MTDAQYKVYKYRWINLIIYTLITFMAGMGFLAMAPLIDMMAQRWSVSFGAASLLISVIGLFQLLLSVPAGWVAGKVGFKPPISVGASLLAVGFLLRGTAGSYSSFMGYTVLAGVGWGLIWSPLGTLVATWFPSREIGLANSLWSVGFLAGQAVGSLTSIPFVTTFGWSQAWSIYGIVSVVLAALGWLLLRPRPPLPPERRPPIEPSGLRDGAKETMNRTNIALQYTVFASVGSLAVAPTLVPPMLIASGVAPALAGVISGLSLVGGTLGALVVPPLAFSRRRVRPLALICALLAPIFFVGIFYAPVDNANLVPAIALNLLFGFTMSPVMSLSMGIGQLQPGVHPGNAAILSGIFLTSIGAGATFFPPLVGGIVDTAGVQAGAWMLTGLAAVSFAALAVFVPEPEQPTGH